MDAESIRLILDLGKSGKDVEEVRRALESLKGTVHSTADGYEVLERQVGEYDVIGAKAAATTTAIARADDLTVGAIKKLAIATDEAATALDEQVRKAVAATAAQRGLARALAETPGPAGAATAALTGLKGERSAGGGGLLGASYGIQDVITVLAMGGGWDRALMSATNNISPMLIGLGAGAGLAGVLGLAVTAFATATPVIQDWYTALTSNKLAIPEAADSVGRLTDAIDKDKKSIEEWKKAKELDYFELEKYQKAVARLKQEEIELTNARAARSVGVYDNKKDRERASAFSEAVGEYGGGEKLVEALKEAGVEQKRAEMMIAYALKGDKLEIHNILDNLKGRGAAAQLGYVDPEEAARRKRHSEETEALLKKNAERIQQEKKDAKQQREDNQTARENSGKLHAEGEKQRRRAALDRIPRFAGPSPIGPQATEALRLQRAMGYQAHLAQGGRLSQAQSRDLANLNQQLGPNMPGQQEAMAMQAIVANQRAMTGTSASLHQVLQQARAILARNQALQWKMQAELQQGPGPTGRSS